MNILSGMKQTLIPPSMEEDDQLVRSAKKIKNGKKLTEEKSYQDQWPKLGTSGKPSFADKLKRINGNKDCCDDDIEEEERVISDDSMSDDAAQEMEEEMEEPVFKTSEDPSRNFPSFVFSGKMKKRLFKAWKKAVIVKLLDRSIGYKALQSRLEALWAKQGVINIINIGYGFYVVKLSNRNDYFSALTGGPWMIYDHYLNVRPWEPNFRPDKATIDRVAVWIRVPGMPLEYYDEEALTIIGNRIGETLKVDMNTTEQLRGHYARLCVLVDLEKQLMSGFSLDGGDYYLEYEGLHLLCTGCGLYGHRVDSCPTKPRQTQTHGGKGNDQQHDKTQEMNEARSSLRDREQWHVVQKSRRQRKLKEYRNGNSRQENMGSRFGVLTEVAAQGNNVWDEDGQRRGMALQQRPPVMEGIGKFRLEKIAGRTTERNSTEEGSEGGGVGMMVTDTFNEGRENNGKWRKEKRTRQELMERVEAGNDFFNAEAEQGRVKELVNDKGFQSGPQRENVFGLKGDENGLLRGGEDLERGNESGVRSGLHQNNEYGLRSVTVNEEKGNGLLEGDEGMDHDQVQFPSSQSGQGIGIEEVDPGDNDPGSVGYVDLSTSPIVNVELEQGEDIMVEETQLVQED